MRLGTLDMSEKDVQMLHSMSDNLLMDAREALGVSSDAAYVSPNHQSAVWWCLLSVHI